MCRGVMAVTLRYVESVPPAKCACVADKMQRWCFHREDKQKHSEGREEARMYGANNVPRKLNIRPITPSQTAR